MNQDSTTKKSLELTTETLRLLTPDQLRLVSGGRHHPQNCTALYSGCAGE